MSEPNEMDKKLAKELEAFIGVNVQYDDDLDDAFTVVWLGQDDAANAIAAYRESIKTPLKAHIEELEAELAAERAKRERLADALDRVVCHAESWHEHFCDLWGERREEQQSRILGDILVARAALDAEKGE